MAEIFSKKTLDRCRSEWTRYLLSRTEGLKESELNALSMDDLQAKFDECVNLHVSPDAYVDPFITTPEDDPAIYHFSISFKTK